MATSIFDLKSAKEKLEELRSERITFEKLHIKDEEILMVENLEYRLLIAQINWLAQHIEETEPNVVIKWEL
jgi:regulator of PEP synthase PpsR (kinase-PPPase family)